MRRLLPLVSVLACLAGWVAPLSAQPGAFGKRPARDVARLSYVSPAVRTQALGQREWYEALPDQPVERSVRVATGAQGGAEIAIGEQLRIQLEPETVVLVRKLPRGARGPSELQLVTGSLLVEIIDGKGIGPLLIRTAVGDVRLRGATVRLVSDAQGRTAIAVYQGLATLRVRALHSVASHLANAGQAAEADRLASLTFAGAPLRVYLANVVTVDGGGDALAMIALFDDRRVEVRLIRGGARPVYAIFDLRA